MTQTIQQLLTELATYLGEQDKAILAQIEAKITQLKNDLLGGEVSADLDTFRELVEELRKLKASGQISVLALQTVVPSPINYPEDEAKLASGDYVVDTNNNELVIQVGEQYTGWVLDSDDAKKVNAEGLLKLQNYVNSSGETVNITLKSPVKATSVLYNHIREVDLNRLVSVTDFTYKFENNTLSELKLHGVLENGKAVSRYLNQNADYLQLLQQHQAGFGSIIDSSYNREIYNSLFSQNGEKPSGSYHIPDDVDSVELTIGHYSFSKTITLHKETPKT